MNPTIDGFLAFAYAQGVPNTTIVSDADANLNLAFNIALEIVNTMLATVAPNLYVLAVYNLAMHYLISLAVDVAPSTYFSALRKKFDLLGGIFGVVTTSSDEGTSVSVEAPDFVKNLSLSDLDYLKTPYGRFYVEIAQRWGLNWGLN